VAAAARTRMTTLMQFLARRRVAIGFVASVAAIWLAQPTRRSLAIGAGTALAGEALRIWAAGHLEKGREVTVSGPYRLTRHPLYMGSALMGAGLALASASLVVSVLVAAYLALTLTAAIRAEEAHLTEKFGRAYPEYRDGRASLVTRRFSARRALANREYRAVMGLAFALALLWWKAIV
jgi:protein-S-isoprenylcysteine O-methyltransferase Ste14